MQKKSAPVIHLFFGDHKKGPPVVNGPQFEEVLQLSHDNSRLFEPLGRFSLGSFWDLGAGLFELK